MAIGTDYLILNSFVRDFKDTKDPIAKTLITTFATVLAEVATKVSDEKYDDGKLTNIIMLETITKALNLAIEDLEAVKINLRGKLN